ncbi:hypothetical protein MRX96_025946 [Rhipicephalus microplus]
MLYSLAAIPRQMLARKRVLREHTVRDFRSASLAKNGTIAGAIWRGCGVALNWITAAADERSPPQKQPWPWQR